MRMGIRTIWKASTVALVALALAIFLVACGGSSSESGAEESHSQEEKGVVHVALQEWSITNAHDAADPLTTHSGAVVFEAHNNGTAPHELVILKTDLSADSLPVVNGKVEEDAEGIEAIGEIEEFPGGKIETGAFNLKPGRYVLICNIPGHYQQGMHAELTVE